MALYMNGQEISQSSGVPIGGATEPYIEEIYNSDGQLISVNMHGYDAIRSYMFSDCSNLALNSLPSGITSIGNNAFQNCTSLTAVTIPASVTSIGSIWRFLKLKARLSIQQPEYLSTRTPSPRLTIVQLSILGDSPVMSTVQSVPSAAAMAQSALTGISFSPDSYFSYSSWEIFSFSAISVIDISRISRSSLIRLGICKSSSFILYLPFRVYAVLV